MEFNQKVNMEIGDRGLSPIDPETYASLDPEEQKQYEPVYLKYRDKKIRDYDVCYECGTTRFAGWVTVQVPVGEPWLYNVAPTLTARMIDVMASSDVLYARALGKALYGDKD